MLNRAYSLLHVKRVDEAARIITGMATTPAPDRAGDVVEPDGAQFKLPMPLLWQHDSHQPIGHVTSAKVTKAGIEIEASITRIAEPGKLRDRLDEAWQSIKAGLVQGLSIGFKALETSIIKETGGIRFLAYELLELSAVTIPANASATITTIKSLDTAQRAASGRELRGVSLNQPGASGHPQRKSAQEGANVKTIAEQITALENKRAASASRMDEVMQKTLDEDRTTNADEADEVDKLNAEVEAVDKDLVRLRQIERMKAFAAKPVFKAENAREGADARGGIIVTQPKLPPGIAFARYVIAKAVSFKEMQPADLIARQRWPDHPEIELALKAAVAPGSSSSLAALVQPTLMASEMIEYLWHRTIVGRITGLRRVPFNIKVPRQTSVASVSWVGEAQPKPLSSFALDTVTLGYYKIAGIVALTDEIIRFSSPAAEAMVRDELANAIVALMDHDFIDPEKAAVANVSPASITNGVTPTAATGTAYANFAADFGTTLAKFDAARIDTSGLAIVMSSRIARSLSLMLNSLGQPLFPSLTATGGTAQGYQVVVSGNVDPTGDVAANGDNIIFVKPDEVLLADDGNVTIDISREASVQMDSAPDSPPLATTVLISAFQHNLALIRAERYCNWLKRRAEAVQFISGAKYA
jgi:HK97 family phage major capsid protein/HK97 family phage prohead protease